jgi:hypothetical protein
MRLYGISWSVEINKEYRRFLFQKASFTREFSVDRPALDGKLEYHCNFDSDPPRKENFLAALIQK